VLFSVNATAKVFVPRLAIWNALSWRICARFASEELEQTLQGSAGRACIALGYEAEPRNEATVFPRRLDS